jgi:primase-polymerase (primpol)-like protein
MNESINGGASGTPDIKLESLVDLRRWVAWQLEKNGERITKVPYDPNRDRKAKADDPDTWGSAKKALARFENLPKPYDDGGIGFELGPLDGATAVGGIDLDTCCTRDTQIAPWAQQVIDRIASYTEWSPSGTGAKTCSSMIPQTS